MTVDQIRRMHRARPFEPFDVNLDGGRRIPVTGPEFLAIAPSGRVIAVAVEKNAIETIDLFRVTGLKRRSRKQ